VLRAGERGREVYLPAGRWYDFWSAAPVAGGRLFRVEAPLDHLPLYVRGGSIVPTTEAMNYVGEKPWDPIRFAIYPDADGAATGSLYEDDGCSPAYQTGAFRRTTVRYSTAGSAARLTLEAPVGPFLPPARTLEFNLVEAPACTSVQLDGQPLSAATTAEFARGWFRKATGALVLRLADDGRAHTFELR
jgi:hypothetical protein